MQVAKRKARGQKQKIDRSNLLKLYSNTDTKISLVKGEIHKVRSKGESEAKGKEEPKHTAKIHDDYFNKPAIVKSLILASLILSLELVLYFVWK